MHVGGNVNQKVLTASKSREYIFQLIYQALRIGTSCCRESQRIVSESCQAYQNSRSLESMYEVVPFESFASHVQLVTKIRNVG